MDCLLSTRRAGLGSHASLSNRCHHSPERHSYARRISCYVPKLICPPAQVHGALSVTTLTAHMPIKTPTS